MGVEGLSKLIKPIREVKLQEFKGQTFAIDALVELNRVFKGQVVLTNKAGEKTHHIHSLLSTILKLEGFGIKQIWVFDHDVSKEKDGDEHFKYKSATLAKRKAIKEKNKERLYIAQTNKAEMENRLATLTEEQKADVDGLFDGLEEEALNKEINTIQKRIDSPQRKEINDLKFMLDTLGIEWVEAPVTFEGEAIAADLVKAGIANYAFTPDLDAIMYGSPYVIKRTGRGKDTKYFLYNLDQTIEDLNIGYEDLIKIGLCLGTDANPDGIKGIGIKTVMAKFENAADWNSAPFKELIQMFGRTFDINKLSFNNVGKPKFTNEQQALLIDWLVEIQSFDRDRVKKQVSNALNFVKTGDIVNKTPNIEIDWDTITAATKKQ
jgi:5'-3' exonuclease